ncbi:hypothetical protein [Endozoicomonas sp. OPT23]|uniref:hypothetical protein n=1 Tax=Endozoicomonas sp. OPT23 TaxID=2072845 RepID=UPI00129AD6A3|nr:hypothetical protein [Endozoicomonas sp. OPT23]
MIASTNWALFIEGEHMGAIQVRRELLELTPVEGKPLRFVQQNEEILDQELEKRCQKK